MVTEKRRGFTLIEVLVVLAIVALLAAVAMPRYFGSMQTARENALKENLRVMRIGIDRFHGDKGRYPNDLQELVAQHYLRDVPVDPVTDSRDSWQPQTQDGAEGLADVRSGASGNDRDGRAYADY